MGSLKEEHRPLDFVIPDQFFDRTRGRVSTFFGDGLVAHISFADPSAPSWPRSWPAPADAGVNVKKGGTYLCMEGPAFSTKAESNVYRSWGMDVIGMTNLQEAKLAREAEICYVTVAMVTDYDCWHPEHDAVTVNEIIANLVKNAENAAQSGPPGDRRHADGLERANAVRRSRTRILTERDEDSPICREEVGTDPRQVSRVKSNRWLKEELSVRLIPVVEVASILHRPSAGD